MNRDQLISFLDDDMLPAEGGDWFRVRKDVTAELLRQLKSIPRLEARANHLDGLNAELSLNLAKEKARADEAEASNKELKNGIRDLSKRHERIDNMRCDTGTHRSYQLITLAQESFDEIVDTLAPLDSPS